MGNSLRLGLFDSFRTSESVGREMRKGRASSRPLGKQKLSPLPPCVPTMLMAATRVVLRGWSEGGYEMKKERARSYLDDNGAVHVRRREKERGKP